MEVLALRLLLAATACLVGAIGAAVVAQAGLAADPPIVSVGPVSDPTGAVTGSGAAGSGGQTDACVNDRHSGTDPRPQDAGGVASVNDASCQSGAPNGSQAGGSAPSNGAQSGGSASAGSPTRSGAVAGVATTGTVTARDARGITIARVRYGRSALRSAGRLRVLVSVRDVDGRLIQDAIVSLRPLPGATQTLPGSRATFTNRRGAATFSLPVAKRMLDRQLRFLIGARTPTARALRLASVRLNPSSATG